MGILGYARAAPRVFFTRYYIFILEGVTSAQLIGLLIVALASGSYLLRKREHAH